MWKLTLFVLPILCAAQSAHVEGRVTNLVGEPLSKATIALMGNTRTPNAPLPPSYSAVSNVEGRFVFDSVEPGAYRVFADRNGYLSYVFTQPDGRTALELAPDAQQKLDIKMTPQSSLSGRVLDEDGEPFPHARVTILRVLRSNGVRQLSPAGNTTTGPDGAFAFASLRADRYYVSASEPLTLTQGNQREAGNAPASYVTTFFPSALDASTAAAIEVPLAAESRHNDIRLRRARTFHILGRVSNAAGETPSSVELNLFDPNLTDPLGLEATRVSAVQGMFQFNRLLPGTYGISARAGMLRARQFVTVTDHDINNLKMTVAPGLEIPVTVSVEDADADQRDRIMSRAYAQYTLTATDRLNENAMISRKPDGAWSFTNIGPGTYRMGISGPEGTYIKSIRYGDRDITTKLLDTTTAASLSIVFSPHAAEVTGVVRNTDGKALPSIPVTLWVPGEVPAGNVDSARSTNTNAKGEFRFVNVRPGEYRIAAWEKIEQGLSGLDLHVLFDTRATKLTLKEDTKEAVQPVLIPADVIATEAARLR